MIGIRVNEMGGDVIANAEKKLAGIHDGLPRALHNALSRASTSGEAEAAKAVRAEYFIKAGDYKLYTKARRRVQSDIGGTQIAIDFAGQHIPLFMADVSMGSNGRPIVRVMRGNAKAALDGAFVARMKSGHVGIFQREEYEYMEKGRFSKQGKRYPDNKHTQKIKQLYAAATTQMMSANEAVQKAVDEKISDTFRKRLDHEVERLLAGYGR